ncbi:MAG TPA: hypothetical protein VJA22_01275 [Patescibacteria group bacterium]|nr:hypothetical protein [Patescibacteria group bacterium]
MGRIILGIVMTVVGVTMALKANWLYVQFGSIGFAEKYLGSSGGTRLFYKFLGIFLAFIGMLVMTNLHGSFIEWVFSPLIRATSGGAVAP